VSTPPANLATVMRQHVRSMLAGADDRQAARSQVGSSTAMQELRMHRVLGRGGFGVVYAATWGGVPAAVKVSYSTSRIATGQDALRQLTPFALVAAAALLHMH
jgi:hypothetical protein